MGGVTVSAPVPDTATPPTIPTAAEFRDVVGRFASGVTIVTTTTGGERFGSTVSAFTSLSDTPPMVLVCLNQSSETGRAIQRSGVFAVNVLGEQHSELAARFARKGPDKFTGVSAVDEALGPPLLTGGIAHLICRVSNMVAAGTHVVFIAAVERAGARSGAPLTYFRGAFRRMPPGRGEGDSLVSVAVPREVLRDADITRTMLEISAAVHAVGRLSQHQLAELQRLMECTLEFAEGDGATGAQGYLDSSRAFHEYIVGLGGSPGAVGLYRALSQHPLADRPFTGVALDHPVLADDHRRLVGAFKRGDVTAAITVLREHTRRRWLLQTDLVFPAASG
jgi:4-nitrophenol 2-monooxygenase / 4-nitrocatechol 4-monooxygenase, reductase component